MSTNYYAVKIPTVKNYTELVDKIKNCPISEAIKYIEKQETKIHLGQFAGGWKFLFKWNEDLYKSYEELIEYLKDCDITSEYGTEVTLGEFEAMVESAQNKKSRFEFQDLNLHNHKYVNGYEFLDADFS